MAKRLVATAAKLAWWGAGLHLRWGSDYFARIGQRLDAIPF